MRSVAGWAMGKGQGRVMIQETWRTERIIREFKEKGYWGEETLWDYLVSTAARLPKKVAVIDPKGSVTYGELARRAEGLALRLKALGLGKGDRVMMLLPDWVEVYYLRYALGRIGAICCIGSIDWRRREMEHALSLTRAVAVAIPRTFKGFDFLETVQEISKRVPSLKHVLLLDEVVPEGCLSLSSMIHDPSEGDHPADRSEGSRPGPNDVDKIQFTAGTTGLAKAVMRFPNNHIAIGKALLERIKITEEDRILSVAPISGGIGIIMAVYAPVLSGATAILHPRFDAGDALRCVEEQRATIVAAVPAQTIKMLEAPGLDRLDLSSLRCWVTAGAPLPIKSWKDIYERLRCPVVTVYGSVDTGLAAISSVDDPPEKVMGSAGRIIPRTEVRIVDDDRNPLPLGQEGEVAIRGATVMAGYFGDPEATRDRIDEDGWGYTGDYGVLDEDGFLRIVGRKKDLIIRGGQNISPKELEDLIMTHPSVMEVSVVGIPDPVMGEKACACVIPKKGHSLSLQELVGYLRSLEIETHKLPERLELMDEFPMSEGKKVQKYRLREMVIGKMTN